METPAKTQPITRSAFLAVGAAAWGTAIFGKLIYLQVLKHKHYAGQPLAMSVPVDSVYVNPKRLPDLRVAADIIAPVLGLDQEQLYARLKSAHSDPKRNVFCWIKRKITAAESADLRSLHLPWIEFQ